MAPLTALLGVADFGKTEDDLLAFHRGAIMAILSANEPAAFRTENPNGGSRFLFTVDHAANLVPQTLAGLGLDAADLRRHIAWDIGIAEVTTRLAARLGAVAVLQNYSRLVIDCNRQPIVPSAFPEVSEDTAIPGNSGLRIVDKRARQSEIFDPYHAEIAAQIAGRRGARPVYIAMHSFTPRYRGVVRQMEVAVLYNRIPRLSHIFAAMLRREGDLAVAENEPYQVTDETDYGVPVHAEGNGLDYLEIEIRQDLIETVPGQIAWADRLARLLPAALEQMETKAA